MAQLVVDALQAYRHCRHPGLCCGQEMQGPSACAGCDGAHIADPRSQLQLGLHSIGCNFASAAFLQPVWLLLLYPVMALGTQGVQARTHMGLLVSHAALVTCSASKRGGMHAMGGISIVAMLG